MQTKKFVCSKLAFLNAFIEEGLKFSSLLYLLLIWIRVLKFVFENPIEVSKHMVNVPFFGGFQKLPTCEHYIDGLDKSMAGLSVSPAPVTPKTKRRLVEIADSEEEEEEVEPPKKEKNKEIETVVIVVKLVKTSVKK